MTIASVTTFARASAATMVDAAGVLRTFGPGLLRRIDGVGSLVEATRANLMLRSEEMTTAPWAVGGSYFRRMEAGDHPQLPPLPDGTGAPVCRYGPTSSTTSFSGNVNNQVVAGPLVPGIYCYAQDFQAVGIATSVRVSHLPVGSSDTGDVGGWVSLTTGAYLAGVATPGNTFGASQTLYSIPLGAGWYRVVLVFEIVREVSNLRLRAFPYAGTGQITGDGSSGLRSTMAQPERGATPTSYIKTEASAVTRAADDLALVFPGPLDIPEYTLLVDAVYPAPPSSAYGPWLNAAAGLNINNIVGVYKPGGSPWGAIVRGAGVNRALIAVPGAVDLSRVRSAIRVRTNDYAVAINGLPVATGGGGAIPTPPTRIAFPVSNTGPYLPGYTVRQVELIPRALSNDELRALSAI